MTEFRYFANAHASTASTWTNEPQECGLCGNVRPGYDGPYYGEEEIEFVCEECLLAGALAERGVTTNEGDPALAPERTAVLEHRTPHLVTWQEMSWPTHCGDYCRFEREVGQSELGELGGAAFFAAHLHPDVDGLEWEDVPPRAPRSADESNSPTVYLFRCVECATPVLWWDVD